LFVTAEQLRNPTAVIASVRAALTVRSNGPKPRHGDISG
jgi:hypothetical protein